MRLRTPSARSSAAVWIFVAASAMPKARPTSLFDWPRTRSVKLIARCDGRIYDKVLRLVQERVSKD